MHLGGKLRDVDDLFDELDGFWLMWEKDDCVAKLTASPTLLHQTMTDDRRYVKCNSFLPPIDTRPLVSLSLKGGSMTSWESFNIKAFYRVFRSLIIAMAMGPVTHLLKAPSALFRRRFTATRRRSTRSYQNQGKVTTLICFKNVDPLIKQH